MKKYALLFLIAFSFCNLEAQTLEPTEKLAKLNIIISNENIIKLEGEQVELTSKTTQKTYSGTTDTEGKFSILLPKGETFIVKYGGAGTNGETRELPIPEMAGLINFNFEIDVPLPKIYTLKNVYFNTGKSTLKSTSFKALNNLFEVMKLKPKMRIEIAGHTDSDGDEATNLKLSQDRAQTVKNYITLKGISGKRINAVGYGETKPIADNSTTEGKQKNRRTDVNVLEQ